VAIDPEILRSQSILFLAAGDARSMQTGDVADSAGRKSTTTRRFRRMRV